ncbi:MAG: CHASE4 domain-containing protein [Deltaproteobacteria bacterium]
MSLRTKTTLIICVTLGALLIVMYGSSHYFLQNNFLSLEKYDAIDQVNRAENTVNDQLISLDTVNQDWSRWDATYSFAVSPDAVFIASNLNDATFENLDVDVVLCYGNSGKLIFKKTVGSRDQGVNSLASQLDRSLRDHYRLIRHADPASFHRGLISLSSQTLLISSRPILNSLAQGPIHGTLVMGRLVDADLTKDLHATIGLGLSLIPYDIWQASLSPDARGTVLNASPGRALVRVVDNRYLQGYEILNDIYGKPAVVLSLDLPRTIYQQGRTSMNYFLVSLLIIGLVFGIMAMLWLEKVILKRLYRLKSSLRRIRDLQDISIRMDIEGNDEISKVGRSINAMLAALEEAHTRLVENDIHLHRITDNMLDILALVDQDGKIQYSSPSFWPNLGYTPEMLAGRSAYELVHPDERQGIKKILSDMIELGFSSTMICRFQHADGHYLWMESAANIMRSPSTGDIAGVVIVGRDITQRKAAEDSLIYISEHDTMTNLYNRAFFRQQISNLDRTAMPNFGFICCDLNGLRLVNDTMGYPVGDDLIISAAELLSVCTPADAKLARTGGDEFTMFVPHAGSSQLDLVCRQIVETVRKYNEEHHDIPLSLSIGSAIGTAVDSVHEVLVTAVGNMYRDKLHQHTSGQSAIVSTLMQALQERDLITSGHADRMEKLVANMAGVCDLSASQVNDLRLLARFHDIGKVGVKDSLLFKPNKLTAEEFIEMQRHCEIGYRIAQSAPHLRHIADWILKHHEWWNGEGYPLGLKGEKIPKECRILAIADAYDAMTTERPYRRPISHEEALEELRRCAGIQFDPWITMDFIYMWQSMGKDNEE